MIRNTYTNFDTAIIQVALKAVYQGGYIIRAPEVEHIVKGKDHKKNKLGYKVIEK